MPKRWISLLIIAVAIPILAPVSTAVRAKSPDGKVDATENSSVQSEVPASRLSRLRRGINLSHWFAQSADYSKAHFESHTTAEDIALIRSIGWTMWDYAGGFAVVNKQNGHATPDAEVVKALGLAVKK